MDPSTELERHVSRRWTSRLAAVVCALAVAVTLTGPADGAPAVIRGIGERWSPTSVTIARGSVVKWRGVSGFHDVTSYGRNWSFARALLAGTVVKRRFRVRGTFRFRCTIHSTLVGTTCLGMCGKVVVGS